MDDPAERVDKTDGRNVENFHVFNIVDHSFANTSPTMYDEITTTIYVIFLTARLPLL